MRAPLVLVVLLVAGCSSAPPPPVGPDTTPTDPVFSTNEAPPAAGRFFLRDQDSLGFRQAGLRHLAFTANTTFKVSALTVVGPAPRWVVLYPTNMTTSSPCGPPEKLRMRHFVTLQDTLSGTNVPAGNYSLLVLGPTLTNLTVQINTTTLAGYRVVNGTTPSMKVDALDADPRIESDAAPYRFSFNKTVVAGNRSILLTYVQVAADGFSQVREFRSKVETNAGTLCTEHRYPTPQAAAGPATLTSTVNAEIGAAGSYSWSGRFEANTALNPRVTAKADLIRFD